MGLIRVRWKETRERENSSESRECDVRESMMYKRKQDHFSSTCSSKARDATAAYTRHHLPTRRPPARRLPAPPHAAHNSPHVVARDERTASSLGASPHTSMQPQLTHPHHLCIALRAQPQLTRSTSASPPTPILTTNASPYTPSCSSPEPPVHPVGPYAQPQLTP